MPQTKIAHKTIDLDSRTVTIAFESGETTACSLNELSEEIVIQLALHGLSQKGGDSYSGEKDLTVAKAKVEKTFERLRAGDWKAVREGGGGRITDLATALANVTGRSLEESVSVIENLDKAKKSELRKVPQIKAEMLRIQQERAAKEVSGEAQGDLASLFSA